MKDQIIQTSLDQFLRHGIRKMSIQKLIEPLGISTKTVYKYFTNKEKLLEEALILFNSRAYEYLDNIPLDETAVCQFYDLWFSAIESLSKANKIFFDDLDRYYPSLGQKMDKVIGKKFRNQLTLLLQKGIQQDHFRKDINPEIYLTSLGLSYRAVVRSDQYKKFNASNMEVFNNSILVFIRGICTLKGLRLLEKHLSVHPISNNK